MLNPFAAGRYARASTQVLESKLNDWRTIGIVSVCEAAFMESAATWTDGDRWKAVRLCYTRETNFLETTCFMPAVSKG
jgi:hypothetical protein